MSEPSMSEPDVQKIVEAFHGIAGSMAVTVKLMKESPPHGAFQKMLELQHGALLALREILQRELPEDEWPEDEWPTIIGE